jgi:1,4-dihydroxy-2-naphthoate octaprenyltransferase/chlorophyll synthase
MSEKIAKMSRGDRWLYALKIKSWPKLLVPFLLGQCMGLVYSDAPSLVTFLLGFCFTVFLLCYIVLLNDYADIAVDTIKRELFPNDCSPKTIPDNILNKNSILIVGLLFGILCILTSVFAEYYLGKPFLILFSLLCVFVFAAYSLPPIRLNYRGGGEFLEMIGVGLMLPLFHFYLQAGMSIDFYLISLLGLSTIFALASALASGLSDEMSDKAGGKTTFVTLLGNVLVRRIINITLVTNYILFLLFFIIYFAKFSLLVPFVLIPYLVYQLLLVLKKSQIAITNAFEAQRIYKDHIHKMIWGSLTIYGILTFFGSMTPPCL